MSEIVFILGAGASHDCGGPLMTNFLEIAQQIRAIGDYGVGAATVHNEHFDRVFSAIGHLQSVHSKAQLDLYNIESILTTLEMAKTIEKLPKTPTAEIEATIESLKHLIVITLERSIQFPVKGQQIVAPNVYQDFARTIKYLIQDSHPRRTVALITFNYDVTLDLALYRQGFSIDYGMETVGRNPPGIPLCKLHGSLNWAVPTAGDGILPVGFDEFFAHWRFQGFDPPAKTELAIGSHLQQHFKQFRHAEVKPYPLIVPPTWNKAEYYRQLGKVWQLATKHLGEAREIYVIGYSLPPTDQFFRLLYALGTEGPQPLSRFTVVDPDPTGEIQRRFRSLLGGAAADRFEYMQTPFSTAIGNILNRYTGRSR